MQLGFVSAILADMTVEEVFEFAGGEGFECVELMCWPPGKADRRYAGVCHINVTDFSPAYADHLRELSQTHGVGISGLGYYPNPLGGDAATRAFLVSHLKKVISASSMLGVGIVNTFIGRDPWKTIDDNFALVHEVWPGLVAHAGCANVRIGIENCPMLFSKDEWPGGKNLAINPATWDRLFAEFPDGTLGLNFDPSHLVYQMIDPARCIRDYGKHLVHFHAKDIRIDPERLQREGIMGSGWHTPKLPGLGEVRWGEIFSALNEVQYAGAVCIEVEDRAYEGSQADRKRGLLQSRRYLSQWF